MPSRHTGVKPVTISLRHETLSWVDSRSEAFRGRTARIEMDLGRYRQILQEAGVELQGLFSRVEMLCLLDAVATDPVPAAVPIRDGLALRVFQPGRHGADVDEVSGVDRFALSERIHGLSLAQAYALLERCEQAILARALAQAGEGVFAEFC